MLGLSPIGIGLRAGMLPSLQGGGAPAQLVEMPAMFHGINLAGAEYADGTYWPSNAIIDYYARKGFNLVRLPFKWSRLQPALNGELDPANLAQMQRVVTRATGHDMWVALDMHNYMRRGVDGQGPDIIGVEGTGITADHYADGWAKIADVFKGNRRVIFNLMNEPHGIDHAISIANQNAAAAAIRATGAENLILFSPGHYSGAHQFNYGSEIQTSLALIEDSNWMLDLHQYLDAGYGGTSPVAIEGAGGASTMGTATAWMRANGVRAIIGEFNSGPSAASQAEIDRMLDYIAANADVYQGWAWWSGGQGMDTPFYDDDPYILDPISSMNPVDKPQMAVLQSQMPQDAGDLPFAPFAVTLTPAGSGELVLAYQPGAGAESHEYRVGGGAWQALGASPATIAGLANGAPATIGLCAVNASGESPVVEVTGTPAAPAIWQPFTGATIDLDFAAGNFHGMALADAVSRVGGLDITGEGLLMQNLVLVSTALRNAAAGTAGAFMLDVEGLPDVWGAAIWGGMRVDSSVSGVAAFHSLEQIAYGNAKVAAPSGAPGARQRIMFAWDTALAPGQRAWITISGKAPANAGDNHAADRATASRFSHIGTLNGTADPVLTATSPNPRLRRLVVWPDAAVSRADAPLFTAPGFAQ